jgi:uncharacterized protein with GYD domain
MPTFIAQGRFTRDAVRGMTSTPEDRSEAVSALFESLGGKMISWYLTTGEYDWFIVAEAPSQDVVVAASIIATGGGGVTDIKTSAAWTGPEAKAIFGKARKAAGSFKSAGMPVGS